MLNENQIKEIREHLEKAQNPLFFFDNDNDGLCSFLILRRFIDRGKGVAIKSFPDLNISYYRKIKELNPDYIFVLDKPLVSEEFLNKVKEDNIPLIWIDHHLVDVKNTENYYNPSIGKNEGEPVSYLCYKIANKKEDIWIAMIGCISDSYLPDFYNEFEKKYPELSKKNPKSAFDLLYGSELGRISRILDFSLKDKTTNVVNMMRFMTQIKNPLDIIQENHKTKQILKRYEQINSKYVKLIERARKSTSDNLIYFQYGGEFSLSSNLANQLIYEFPNKIVIVAYIKGDFANISLRGENVLRLTLESIKGIEDATGGGHKNATGAKMNVNSLSLFKERIENLINKI